MEPKTKLNERTIARILATRYFDSRTDIIVDNVFGMFRGERDLIVLITRSMYIYEVEIKISKADFKKDCEKDHHHFDHRNRIRGMYYAYPEFMNAWMLENCDPKYGLLCVMEAGTVTKMRACKPEKYTNKTTMEEAFYLARLAHIRYWNIRVRVEKEKP